MTIDWKFIAGLEASKLVGYVPEEGDSGVTIATGVDLGQQHEDAITPLPFADRLRPYLGLKGETAAQTLASHPLALAQGEADQLDARVRAIVIAPMAARYGVVAGVPFDSIINSGQTVVASVTWQYGTPWVRCPRFWAKAAARDWAGVVAELRNFGDAYPTRRNREADYLEGAIS